jgi:hypothetical protein
MRIGDMGREDSRRQVKRCIQRSLEMERLELKAHDSDYISARIANFSDESPEQLRLHLLYVIEHVALPLYLGWTETIGLRPNGAVVRWSAEGDYSGVLPVESPSDVLMGLVQGAKRYPELAGLLPKRGNKDAACFCQTHPAFTDGKIICGECGGLGWKPTEWLKARGVNG